MCKKWIYRWLHASELHMIKTFTLVTNFNIFERIPYVLMQERLVTQPQRERKYKAINLI